MFTRGKNKCLNSKQAEPLQKDLKKQPPASSNTKEPTSGIYLPPKTPAGKDA
jgi:hypothetical protein